MATTKVTITIGVHLVGELDRVVREGRFPNRSKAVHAALTKMLARRKRLAEELGGLEYREEQALAEEGLPIFQ